MSNPPFVSVVVPVYNGAAIVEDLLQSLLALDYPAECREIIVVDNGSTDRTRQIVGRYPVRLLEEREIKGAAAARNKGILHARGDIIAFTDADCVADRDWLRMLVADHEDPSIGGFVGETRGHEPPRTIVEAVHNQARTLSPFRIERSADGVQEVEHKRRALVEPRTVLERLWFRLGLITYYRKAPSVPPLHNAPTTNVAYRRAVFDQIGLFDVGMLRGQDTEFAFRMQLTSDFRFHAAPEAIIYHKHRATVSGLFAQRARYGLARVLILDKYIGLDPSVRRQAILESCLNIVFSLPYMLGALGSRSVKVLVQGQPRSTYLYEPLIDYVRNIGTNYGRLKALLTGVRVNSTATGGQCFHKVTPLERT